MKYAALSTMFMIGEAEGKLSWGECPKVSYLEKFDKSAYVGKWYEIFRDKHNLYTHHADCVTREFASNKEGNVDLYFRGFYNLFGWGFYNGIDGTLYNCDEGSADSFTCMATMGHWSSQKYPI